MAVEENGYATSTWSAVAQHPLRLRAASSWLLRPGAETMLARSATRPPADQGVCGQTGLMRRRLIVLRHAKSDWSGGVADHDRPLAGRGRREAALAGRWLRENAADIDLVVCSSAKRARQTWKLVAKQLDNAPPARVDDRLYAASVRGLLAVVRKLPESARAVLLIGHNPGLEELVADLGGVGWPMKTSSIAVLSSRSEWAEVGARWAKLEASLTPRS